MIFSDLLSRALDLEFLSAEEGLFLFKNNSLKLINENIIKKWGMDIIYIAHMPDTN